MNILTFDIEEWYLEKSRHGGRMSRYKLFDDAFSKLMDDLDKFNVKATFFCLGKMALDFPHVVKSISERGHEVGCHSNEHTLLHEMTDEELLIDTEEALKSLEDVTGQKVVSYRAPAFSIGQKNKNAIEILHYCGIKRDASIFPAERDFGGFSQFGQKTPSLVFYNNFCMKEFPICTTKLIGKELAYSGGGYFRFFPLSYVCKEMEKSDYTMTYFHIGDLIPETNRVMTKAEYEKVFKEPGSLKNRYVRYVKTNIGKKNAYGKLMRLIDKEDFVNLEQADQVIDWEIVPSIVL